MANADYYREQAQTCLHMSRICPDPVLAGRLDSLAAEFKRAAVQIDHDDGAAYPPYRQTYGHARKRA